MRIDIVRHAIRFIQRVAPLAAECGRLSARTSRGMLVKQPAVDIPQVDCNTDPTFVPDPVEVRTRSRRRPCAFHHVSERSVPRRIKTFELLEDQV
jgi:hypothetical protein